MNSETILAQIDRKIDEVKALRDSFAEAAARTQSILDACEALGVTRIGIGKRDESFKDSKGHPFGAGGSIFADGRCDGDWPIAWRVAAKARVAGGAGNSGQHQISGDTINGIYEFRDGNWSRLTA